jgi:HAD superfamily hydrolase (TIGR01509 family)
MIQSEHESVRRSSSCTRALVFDFDGLVLDTESPIFDIWREVYGEYGQQLHLDEWRHALGTVDGFDPIARLETLSRRSLDRDALTTAVRERHYEACSSLPILPGVSDLLASARALGLKTALASSSPGEWVRHWLDRHLLNDRFDVVCVREDVRRVKPSPELFLLAARRLDVSAEDCIVFEDSPNGVRAAREAGSACVAVKNKLTGALDLSSADLVLNSLAEVSLAELLFRLNRSVDLKTSRPPKINPMSPFPVSE